MIPCKMCTFWVKDSGRDAKEGECHRNPPTVIGAIEINSVTKMPGTKIYFIFPRTKDIGECGEGQPKYENVIDRIK